MNRQHYDKIIELIDSQVAPLGYECIEVEWDSLERTLRVFIDGAQGIRMEDCLRVNDILIATPDLDEHVPHDYRLEVSSPGVERPLRTREHFSKACGQKVNVRLSVKTLDRIEGTGKLVGISKEDVVSMELPSGEWTFPFQTIRKAHVVFEW